MAATRNHTISSKSLEALHAQVYIMNKNSHEFHHIQRKNKSALSGYRISYMMQQYLLPPINVDPTTYNNSISAI